MPELTSLFPDVADALDIESVAIVEKDYFVVDLLRLLKEIKTRNTYSRVCRRYRIIKSRYLAKQNVRRY